MAPRAREQSGGDAYDVLILGAGAAGLSAAVTIATAGKRVALIEARGRAGGRIFTRHVVASDAPAAGGARHSTLPVELGAEFIHGLPENTWRLVREAGLETYELNGCPLRFAGGSLSPAPDGGVGSLLEDMGRWLRVQPEGTDITFADYLQLIHLDAARRRAAIRYVEGFNAADHRLIGVAALAKQQEAEERTAADRLFHLRAGYDALPNYLLKRLETAGGQAFFEKPVTSVRWSPGAVALNGIDSSGNRFEFRGRRAIIALPLGVLQTGAVRFDPEPDTILTAARSMAMGSVIRIPMLFRSRFWRDAECLARFPQLGAELEQLGFLFTENSVPATFWTSHPHEAPMLTAWTAGPDISLFGRGDRTGDPPAGKSALIGPCLDTLAKIFDTSSDTLEAELVSWHHHDWDADQYARGSYSYMPSGSLHASNRMAEAAARTLYFAGEHTTTTGHWGTVHGALQSGAAAAAQILSD